MQSTSRETLDWKKPQAGIKIAGRNINNLGYTDDTTLMAESEQLEKAKAPHSSTLAWRIPWREEPGRLHTVHGVTKSRTRLSDFTHS